MIWSLLIEGLLVLLLTATIYFAIRLNKRLTVLRVEKEQLETELLTVYLPKQLSEEELNTVIEKVINDTKSESIRDMSKVMKVLKEDFGDQCDFQKASKFSSQYILV